ncbi:cysteine--tRNA ligase, partial [Nitrospinae bacterium AH_259_B05_G02_I21]|nr:cysteine--tRNA ligase [Nitrospinae bacterium AH_259_B05_G02_I21]
QALSDAKKNLDYFYTTQERCEEMVGEDGLEAEAPRPAQAHPAWEEVAGMEAAFRGAMDDDFNSALALGNLFRAAGAVNTFLDS